MKKVLFLVPHLSTGGMPQYTFDLMRKIKDEVQVYCVEYSMISPDFVVQRNRIIDLLGERFTCLGNDKNELFEVINNIQPDIIHLQEVPEYFLDTEISTKLYAKNRNYLIVETSHDSSFSATNKRFYPDYFALISEYQRNEFSKLGIPIDLIEADIEYKERQDRTEGLLKLGLDPSLKHILNVGLFTPRKNQAEAIEYARSLQDYPIQFHFVGNQADNFKDYWEPLLNNLPSNVKIWGERSDVDDFYSCMDMMLFTSRGTDNDKETSPLVIRESIGYNLPALIYNLPVYLNMYERFESIYYLKDDMEKNLNTILEKLSLNTLKDFDYKFDISYDSSDNKVLITSKQDVENILVSIRDIDSSAVIWSVTYPHLPKDLTYWVIPTPKSFMDFEKDPYFGGMTVEVYKDNTLLTSRDIRIKQPIVKKPKLRLKNVSEPVFMNYNEFFIQKIYDRFLKGKDYKTVVDVGANIGMWIEYLHTIANVERIYAIEPNKKALQILNNSNLPNVIVLDKALVDVDKQLDFFVSEENSTISSIRQYGGLNTSYIVDGISFKTFLKTQSIQSIDLFKVDIEAGEYDLFNSMNEDDFSHIKEILVEFHLLAGKTFDVDVKNLIAKLEQMGYFCDVNRLHDIGGFIFATRTKPQPHNTNIQLFEKLEQTPCGDKRKLASLINELYPNGVGVEIGVLRGDYSKIILDEWSNGTIYLIDTWRHMSDYIDMNGRDDEYHYECMVQTAKNIKQHQNRAHMIRMDSNLSADLFPDEYFDFIFIDADHSYGAVVKDIKCWWPKIKKGGIFAGDDYIPDDGDIWLIDNATGNKEYAGKFGVRKAVTEFATQLGLKIYSTTDEPYWKQWYTFKPF